MKATLPIAAILIDATLGFSILPPSGSGIAHNVSIIVASAVISVHMSFQTFKGEISAASLNNTISRDKRLNPNIGSPARDDASYKPRRYENICFALPRNSRADEHP